MKEAKERVTRFVLRKQIKDKDIWLIHQGTKDKIRQRWLLIEVKRPRYGFTVHSSRNQREVKNTVVVRRRNKAKIRINGCSLRNEGHDKDTRVVHRGNKAKIRIH